MTNKENTHHARLERAARTQRARMYRLAQSIKTQDKLDLILLEMRNPRHRAVFFDMLKPMLKFKAEYTDRVRTYDPEFKPINQAKTEVRR